MLPTVTDLQGKMPGKTLLITAGMDGDEYAGIEAATQLIEAFPSRAFAGRLIVIPMMNIAGFEAGCSHNPMDKKYPKNIFPGRANGTASEQLIDWLTKNFIHHADAWIDLHGGAKDEYLKPFIWTWETGVAEIDAFIKKFHHIVSADPIVFEHAGFFSKPKRLACLGCPYIMTESGQLGERNPPDIERHILWVRELMGLMEMMDWEHKNTHAPIIKKSADGLWRKIN
ncbi:hypothetical protein FJZ48_00995 [Candidatus Uhrbacteria bacterium]|nr:hypothetical protein [Candidatus Uhrbacteria bacterium]